MMPRETPPPARKSPRKPASAKPRKSEHIKVEKPAPAQASTAGLLDGVTDLSADMRLAGDELTRISESLLRAATDGLSRIGQEIESYGRASLDDNLKATRALLSAHSLPEALELHYGFYVEAAKGYGDHLRRLQAIGLDLTRQALTPVMDEPLFWPLPTPANK